MIKREYRGLVEKLKKRGQLEYLGADGNIILEGILKKWDGKVWTRDS
jgi:hypothetical protein